jgi:uncharacterized protein
MMNRRQLAPVLAALALATATFSPAVFAASASADAEEKVVYHVNDSDNASAALRNIGNHLSASPEAKIVVVTHSKGIDFLLNDAKDKNGNPYELIVQRLKGKGVDFRVCNNTLVSRKMDASTVISEASIVPSGVAEIGRLQAKEGYVYLKP